MYYPSIKLSLPVDYHSVKSVRGVRTYTYDIDEDFYRMQMGSTYFNNEIFETFNASNAHRATSFYTAPYFSKHE